MNNRKLFLHNSKGMSLIEVMFALFISAVAILTMNIFATQMNIENKKLADNSTTARKNYDFLELMNNPTTWKATVLDVNNYAYFSCKLGLAPHPDTKTAIDCTKVEDTFRIIGGDKEVIYDQKDKDAFGKKIGFTAEGIKCYGFDATSGNDSCPTHYQISWDLPCVKKSNCKEPMAKVTVTQMTKYSTKPGLNSEKTFSLNVNLPQSVEIAPRDSTFMVNINSSDMVFEVLKTDFAVETFNLKITSVSSSSNSVVSVDSNKIKYSPKPNFYGVDKVYYTIEQNLFDKVSKSEGVVWVKVMTPYTWVGDGPIAETSASGKKWYSLYDKRNYCGKVVSEKCDHFGAEADAKFADLSDAQMQLAALVFNENCNNCNALLKSSNGGTINLNSLEMGENFPGELKQIDDISFIIRRNSSNRQSDDPEMLFAFSQKGGSFIGANSKADFVTDEVYAQTKNFRIERDIWTGNGPRTITRGALSMNTYGHFLVAGGKFYAPESMLLLSGFNQITNQKYFFHQNGTITVGPRWGGGNIFDAQDVTLNDFVINYAGAFDYNMIGNMSVRDLTYIQTGYESQLRGYISPGAGNLFVSRNVYMRGAGGFMVNGWGGWGYANIVMNGKGDQYIYSNLDVDGNPDKTKMGRMPVLVVNKTDGTLHIKGDLGFTTGIDYQAGIIKFYDDEERAVGDRQILEFSSAWNDMFVKNTSGNELVLPNLELTPQCSHMRIYTDFRISGDLIHDKRKYNPQCSGYTFGPNIRKISVEGDIYALSGYNEHDGGGIVTIEMTGSKNQKIVGSNDSAVTGNVDKFLINSVSNLDVATLGTDPQIVTTVNEVAGYLPNLDIKKDAGTVTMIGAIGFMERFRIISGEVSASKATIGFTNSNGYGAGTIDLTGVPGKRIVIKGLTTNRNLDLGGATVTITGGLNLPSAPGGYNYPSISNGRIELMGDLYYNTNFEPVTSDVDRATLAFVGSNAQTVYSTMSQEAGRIGTFDFEIKKTNPTDVVKMNCLGYAPSMLYMESLKVDVGTFSMDNCSLKVTKAVEVNNGIIDRGATPGQFQYGSLDNKGTIVPSIVAGK